MRKSREKAVQKVIKPYVYPLQRYLRTPGVIKKAALFDSGFWGFERRLYVVANFFLSKNGRFFCPKHVLILDILGDLFLITF